MDLQINPQYQILPIEVSYCCRIGKTFQLFFTFIWIISKAYKILIIQKLNKYDDVS
jgi:hypothetical protein